MTRAEDRHLTSHIDADVCLDLLGGLVPEPERERVLAHLARCAPCEELLRGYAAVLERLRAEAPVALRPATVRVPALPEPRPENWWGALSRSFQGAAGGRRLALAGSLAALAVVAVVARGPRVEQTASRANVPAPEVHWLPGAETDVVNRASWDAPVSEVVRSGVEAYARRDLDEARRILASTRSEGALELLRQVFLGSACALQSDFAAAEGILAHLPMEEVPEPWRGEAHWTLYAAYEARGAHSQADSLLALIAAGPGPLSSRARAYSRRP